jgi:hypothetical protein
MKRSAATTAALLLIALCAAWIEWTSVEQVDLEGKVVLLQGEADDISEVRWVSEDTEVTISRKDDAFGGYYWVDYTRWTKKKLPAARDTEDTGEASDEPEVERTATHSAFKAAQKADDLMASLSPMAAQRSLVVTDEAKIEEIGLKESTTTIEVDRSGRTQKLLVGGEAYGTRDYYVQHEESGKIFLVDRALVQPLKYARTRLPDRSLFALAIPDVLSATVSVADRSAQFLQVHPDDQRLSAWASVATPDEPGEQATTWMGKFLKLKGTRYADPAAPPEGLVSRFKVSLVSKEGSTTVAISQVGEDGDWYAQSEHTRGLIKLVRSGAVALSDDVGGLLGADG